ncbi:hypothetical protein G3O06_37940 [Burkholderia sp. Ac-20345]|uniref:hypothetical protein n=1 Tax=Burkholderia sp. Ac-20345 TaxID=2703891 RepID=UPI00197B345C|nr:hypothetical protein [Burkholderia sp. Ac-20345]MBN3783261.1 hypothetical protein [Burkholderia sp. Ac-20345]
MTVFCVLFADVSNGEQPIFISDVLLTAELRHSADGERYEKTYIPSIGGTFPQVSQNASISGLIQKTYILPMGHCLSLAGDFESVLNFYAEIKSKTDLFDVANIISRYKKSLQFAVAMLDRDTDRIYLCATESCRQLTPGSYGSVLIGGSGHNTLRKLLIAHQHRPFVGDPALDSIGRALVLINEALEMDESAPIETLGEHFGAYYEIAEFTGSQFVKIDNVAHHYVTIKIIDGTAHWILEKSYYHEYCGGNLLVRRISWGQDFVWQDCYVIGGFNGPVNLREVQLRVSDTAPIPMFEVIRLKFETSNFRVVSNRRHLIKIRKEGDRWFGDVDNIAANELANYIADELEATRTS